MNKQVISFVLNGEQRELEIEPNELLMNVLRERENLTGTKYGCGIAQCGACTVLIDGEPVTSCRTKAGEVQGKRITTIEGLGTIEKPGGSSIGTSFNECTAMSARPSCKATSSSLRNRPLPPISASGRSMIWSPRVVIGTNWMSSPACAARRRAATCSACHRASALWRVAMRSRFTASAPVCATPAGCDD